MAAVLLPKTDKDEKIASDSNTLIAKLKEAQNKAQAMDCDIA